MSTALEYLRTSPLTWIFVTLLAYRVGVWLRDRTSGHPVAQPVFIAAGLVMALVAAVDLDYDTYMEGGRLIHVLLGPATVALAVPLHRQAHHLKEMLVPLLVALPVGTVVSIGSAVLMVRALGGAQAHVTLEMKAGVIPVTGRPVAMVPPMLVSMSEARITPPRQVSEESLRRLQDVLG